MRRFLKARVGPIPLWGAILLAWAVVSALVFSPTALVLLAVILIPAVLLQDLIRGVGRRRERERTASAH